MIEQDAKILTNIQKTLTADPNATQRTLAQNSNISLGMMNEYAEKIAEVIQNAKAAGRTKVVLAGQSNIRFVIEYICEKLGLIFAEVEDYAKINNNELVLCGELLDEKNCKQLCEQGAVSVMEI